MKSVRRLATLLLLASVMAVQAVPSKDVQVYVTNTGKKFHISSCRYLSKSKIAISKTKAIKQGYTACKICKP
jgi:hypothetical protein